MGQFASMRWLGVSGVVSAITGTNYPSVGERFRDPSNDFDYVFVYNDGNSEIYPGDAAVLGSGVAGASVTVTMTSGFNLGFGLCRNATISTGMYGFLLQNGFGKVNMAANVSCALGDPLMLAANGKWANKSISTGAMGNVCGQALAAIASGVSGSAYVRF